MRSGLKDSKELEINLQKDFNVTLQYAFPLCIILSDKNLYPWFYENYIQICAYIYMDNNYDVGIPDSYYYDDIDFLDSRIITYTLLDHCILKYTSDIVNIITEKIEKGSYSIVFLDEYYIPKRKASRQYNYVHEFLIYGYDNHKSVFKVAAFNEYISFTHFEINYKDFLHAYKSSIINCHKRMENWISDKLIIFIKLNKFLDRYPFDINKFLTKLHHNVNSSIDPRYTYFKRIKENSKILGLKYGLEVYDVLRDYLIYILKLIESGIKKQDYTQFYVYFMDRYKMFHLFYENKHAIKVRLEYLKDSYNTSSNFNQLIDNYFEIEKSANVIRQIYIKTYLLIEVCSSAKENKRIILNKINSIINYLNQMKSQETLYLKKVIHFIETELL